MLSRGVVGCCATSMYYNIIIAITACRIFMGLAHIIPLIGLSNPSKGFQEIMLFNEAVNIVNESQKIIEGPGARVGEGLAPADRRRERVYSLRPVSVRHHAARPAPRPGGHGTTQAEDGRTL